jgi:hypothetical protein
MSGKFEAALRKLVYGLGDPDGEEPGLFEAVRETIARVETVETRSEATQSELDQLRERIDSLERVVHAEGKRGKVEAIISYAENKRTQDQPAVVLSAQEIKGATGCTRRYAYDIIEEYSEDFAFLVDRENLTQYGELEMANREDRGRGLAVVFDASVHTDLEGVNRFTTRVEADGGEP